MERKFSIHYYRNGLSTYTVVDTPLQLLHRLIVLLNDMEVRDLRVTEFCECDSTFDSKY